MSDQETGNYRLVCRSCIPGRQRWAASPLRDRPTIARAAERYLLQSPGVYEVHASSVTGRILVLHDPSIPVDVIADEVREVIDAIWAEYGDSTSVRQASRLRRRFQRELGKELLFSGGVIAIQRVVFGGAGLSTLGIVGTGVAALAFAGAHSYRARNAEAAATGQRKKHPMLRLLQHSPGRLPRIALASAASVGNRLAELAPPLLIGSAVDVMVGGTSVIANMLGAGASVGSQLGRLAMASIGVWGLESGFEYAQKVLWRDLAQSVQHDLRVAAYDHVQRLDMRYFEDESVGDLAATLNSDVNQLELFFNESADDLLQGATAIAVVGALLFAASPLVSLAALLPIPLSLLGASYFQKRISPLYAEAREELGRVNGRLVSNLGGIATIKSFTAEDYETESVRAQSDVYVQKNSQANKLYAAFGPVIRGASLSGFVGTVLVGGRAVASGAMSAGTFSVLVYMVQRMRWPMMAMSKAADRYKRAMTSAVRVLDVLDVEPALADGSRSLDLESVRGNIVFENVKFGYDEKSPVLQNLNLEIPARSTVAIVGETGCGKTTVIKMLLRFFEADSGRVLLDGQDIRELKIRDLRAAVGLVNQELFLFEGTIRDNIAYGNLSATEDQIIAAARSAEAHTFIMQCPDGYDALVGERGMKLSGGQRQRICLARAILKNPPILVLDEATSSVDNETEAAIQRSLEAVSVGRTTLIIAHRLSSVRSADLIYVLSRGQLAESGTHDELLRRGGRYARLWRAQAGAESIGPAQK